MRNLLYAALLALAACGNSTPESKTDSVANIPPADHAGETWIYFSQNTFVENDFARGITTPHVKRRLTSEEKVFLDSVLQGYFNPPPDSMPRPSVGCYWPKHGVRTYDSKGTAYDVNICFQCDKIRTDHGYFSMAAIEAWSIFFQRMGWPTGADTQQFFDRAAVDTAFRSRSGIFVLR
jgi:hypothetical protein